MTAANTTGNGWGDAFTKAQAFVKQLNLQQKAQMVTGSAGPCVVSFTTVIIAAQTRERTKDTSRAILLPYTT